MRPNAILAIAFGVAGILAVAAANDWLGLLAIGVLALGSYLLWRPGISPVFIFVFGYQWLQASTKIFDADLQGVPINEISQFGGDIERATFLSLIGLVALAIGFAIPLLNRSRFRPAQTAFQLNDKPPMFWFWLYLSAFVASFVAHSLAYVVPGLSQPMLALADLKWAFFWLFAHLAIQRGGTIRWIWFAFFLFELASGVTGYFSDFKTVLFFTLFAVLSSGMRLSGARLLGMILVFLVAIVMAIGWTAIKMEQRKFLSQDENAQIVRVSTEDSMLNIVKLASRLDMEAMRLATLKLASRVEYVDFFGKVIDVVPDEVPYEGGAIWGDAIVRPFMPRILFPNKTVIDDSERTAYYTGMYIMGAADGVSISIGYMGESYIDFGPWLMWLPVFCLGYACAFYYRWLVDGRAGHRMVNIGLASATLFPVAYLETSITKLLGGMVASALVAWLVARYVVPMLFARRQELGWRLPR